MSVGTIYASIRRKEPILGQVSKNYEKNSGSKGLN